MVISGATFWFMNVELATTVIVSDLYVLITRIRKKECNFTVADEECRRRVGVRKRAREIVPGIKEFVISFCNSCPWLVTDFDYI